MTIYSRPAHFLAVALLFSFAAGGGAGIARGQSFSTLTGAVDLAGYQPDKVNVPAEIAKPISGAFDAVKLSLVNADAPIKGPFERYDVEAEPAAQAWRVDSVTKTMTRKPVGRFKLA